MTRALVGNAADEAQVQRARQSAKDQRTQELADLRAVLALPEGRRFLWRVLEHCAVNRSIWHPSALIHHNAGKQDVGHFLQAEIMEARPKALFQMMRDAHHDHLAEETESDG